MSPCTCGHTSIWHPGANGVCLAPLCGCDGFKDFAKKEEARGASPAAKLQPPVPLGEKAAGGAGDGVSRELRIEEICSVLEVLHRDAKALVRRCEEALTRARALVST